MRTITVFNAAETADFVVVVGIARCLSSLGSRP
jgi:hypothetical protein